MSARDVGREEFQYTNPPLTKDPLIIPANALVCSYPAADVTYFKTKTAGRLSCLPDVPLPIFRCQAMIWHWTENHSCTHGCSC